MSKAETKAAEIFDLSGDNVRKIAEQGLTQTREAYEKFSATAKQTATWIDTSAAVVAKGLSEFNAKAFEAVQANTYSTLDYLSALAASKTVSDAAALQSAHAEKQIKVLNEQTKDLSDLAQKIVKESFEPLKGQIEKTFNAAA
jgi:phasin